MIKRLIFDLDNTLIMWRDSYKSAIKNTIQKYDLDIDYLLVDEVIESYEKYYNYYSKEHMLELINHKFDLKLDISFLEDWLIELGKMADIEDDIIETLEYLSSKYELVVLTNWFKDSQLKRLEKVGIDKYFKEIYGGDKYIKPSLESYKIAMGNKNPNECIMIGDNYITDIEGAINAGLQAIMITSKDFTSNDFYKVIHNINELKEML
jgi:putative hydrolase of the HAD superfamily